jgi:MOSC domain-containing protein
MPERSAYACGQASSRGPRHDARRKQDPFRSNRGGPGEPLRRAHTLMCAHESAEGGKNGLTRVHEAVMTQLGTVTALRRYPVKSMLGERLETVDVTSSGLEGDRAVALIDVETGRVASAKHPSSWRGLLALSSAWNGGDPRITLPDGATIAAADAAGPVSALLRRQVRVSTARPLHAAVARPAPEDVIAAGDDVDVPFALLEIGQGTPGSTFVDYAPVHVITSSTLAHVGVESVRYRPNVVLETPGGEPFAENDWTGRELTLGDVTLRVLIPTPRCAVPTLAHGELPRRPDAVRTLLRENRIDVPGFGSLPCLGAYAQVIGPGVIHLGDRASLQNAAPH